MRYYRIQILQPNSTTPLREWTSYPKVGNSFVNDPGALNVVVDAMVQNYHAAGQYSAIQIQGIPIADASQAHNWSGYNFRMFAGFQAGLPLNNPSQSGLILEGTIYQSFGNWVGTEMTVDFVVAVNGSFPGGPGISFNWPAGTKLATALANALTSAYPGVQQTINVNPNLVLNHDQYGFYPDLPSFAEMIKELSASIIGGTYSGVNLAPVPGKGFLAADGAPAPTTPQAGSSITVPATDPKLWLPTNQGGYSGDAVKNPDGTYTITGMGQSASTIGVSGASVDPTPTPPTPATPPIQIAFQDLIGQPTWIALGMIQFMCPMRADIAVNNNIVLPKGLLGNASNPTGLPGAVITTSASQPNAKQSSLFNGTFFVSQVHHVGDFRQPDGHAWVTIINASEQNG